MSLLVASTFIIICIWNYIIKVKSHFKMTEAINKVIMGKRQMGIFSRLHEVPFKINSAFEVPWDSRRYHRPFELIWSLIVRSPHWSQIAKILGSASIRHRSDAKMSDRCLIDINTSILDCLVLLGWPWSGTKHIDVYINMPKQSGSKPVQTSVAYFTKEINPSLARPPLKFKVGLAKTHQ